MWLIKTFLTTAALQLKRHFKGTRLYALLICSELFCCTAGCLVILSSKVARQNISVAKGNCESVIPCIEQISFILRLLASSYILWLRGDVSLLTYSALAMLCFRRFWVSVSTRRRARYSRWMWWMLNKRAVACCSFSRGFGGEMKRCVARSPSLQKSTYEPSTPNFATVDGKVMMLRYSLEDSSVSHPQPNLRYSTVGLPLHPRGCLLRACEAQWTEFQWADSFLCLSVRTYKVHIRCNDLALSRNAETPLFSAHLPLPHLSFIHSHRPALSLSLSLAAFSLPCLLFLALLRSLWALFPFSAILSSLQRRVPCTNRMTGQP